MMYDIYSKQGLMMAEALTFAEQAEKGSIYL